jgi:hypothetical protein
MVSGPRQSSRINEPRNQQPRSYLLPQAGFDLLEGPLHARIFDRPDFALGLIA